MEGGAEGVFGDGIGYLNRERRAFGADAFSPETDCGFGQLT